MGKFIIYSGGDNRYEGSLVYSNERAAKEVDKLQKQIDDYPVEIYRMQLRASEAAIAADIAYAEATAAVDAWATCEKDPACTNGTALEAEMRAKMKKLEDAKIAYAGFRQGVRLLRLYEMRDRKRVALLLATAPTAETKTLWSADNVDEEDWPAAMQEVGTIELPYVKTTNPDGLELGGSLSVVYPLYSRSAYDAAQDKTIRHAFGQTAEQVAFNQAAWPAREIFSPRYATATIVSIDRATGTAVVDCYGVANGGDAPAEFPAPLRVYGARFEYMACGAYAFRPGDYVIVRFAAERAQPTIIGFVRNARKCPQRAGWRLGSGAMTRDSYAPASDWTWLASGGQGGNLSWTGGVGRNVTVSWKGPIGKHFGPFNLDYFQTPYDNFVWVPASVTASGVINFGQKVYGAFARWESVDGSPKAWSIFALCRRSDADVEELYRWRSGSISTVWSAALPKIYPQAPGYSYDRAQAKYQAHPVFFNRSGTKGVGIVTQANLSFEQFLGHWDASSGFLRYEERDRGGTSIEYTNALPNKGYKVGGKHSYVIAAEYVDDELVYMTWELSSSGENSGSYSGTPPASFERFCLGETLSEIKLSTGETLYSTTNVYDAFDPSTNEKLASTEWEGRALSTERRPWVLAADVAGARVTLWIEEKVSTSRSGYAGTSGGVTSRVDLSVLNGEYTAAGESQAAGPDFGLLNGYPAPNTTYLYSVSNYSWLTSRHNASSGLYVATAFDAAYGPNGTYVVELPAMTINAGDSSVFSRNDLRAATPYRWFSNDLPQTKIAEKAGIGQPYPALGVYAL